MTSETLSTEIFKHKGTGLPTKDETLKTTLNS